MREVHSTVLRAPEAALGVDEIRCVVIVRSRELGVW